MKNLMLYKKREDYGISIKEAAYLLELSEKTLRKYEIDIAPKFITCMKLYFIFSFDMYGLFSDDKTEIDTNDNDVQKRLIKLFPKEVKEILDAQTKEANKKIIKYMKENFRYPQKDVEKYLLIEFRTFQRYKCGKSPITVDFIKIIIEKFGVSKSDFLNIEEFRKEYLRKILSLQPDKEQG